MSLQNSNSKGTCVCFIHKNTYFQPLLIEKSGLQEVQNVFCSPVHIFFYDDRNQKVCIQLLLKLE